MKCIRTLVALCLCFSITGLHAQDEEVSTQGYFSFGATMSDYTFQHASKYPATSGVNLGIQVSYWKPLIPHIFFSANLGVDRSDFPAGFLQGDTLGQSGIALHADALIHIKAFARNVAVNPFLTAGAGWGSFAYQQAFYAPLGAGVDIHFIGSSMLILQGQIRQPLSKNITNSFMFYSASVALNMPGSRHKKDKNSRKDAAKEALSSADVNNRNGADSSATKATAKNNAKTPAFNAADTAMAKNSSDSVAQANAQNPAADSDGDGVPDKYDKCPGVKGSADNDGCPFPPTDDADLATMSTDSATYTIYFSYDRSDLAGKDFDVLGRILNMLQSDKTLTLHISGFADTQGTQARNMKISADRANVTLDYFLSYHIPSARILMSYYGSAHPVDLEQQWRNRRVEITVIKH